MEYFENFLVTAGLLSFLAAGMLLVGWLIRREIRLREEAEQQSRTVASDDN